MKYALLSTNSTISHLTNPLNLPLVHAICSEYQGYLIEGTEGCSFLIPALAKKAYRVDFETGKMAQRSAKLIYQRELIARACIIKTLTRRTRILDATAGFGRDAFILAVSGAEVTMAERSPLVALLLQDGLNRISDPCLQQRLTLLHQDSREILHNLITCDDKPDVVYLDPMFENLSRPAKVKKDLQILQALLHNESHDQSDLLPPALAVATSRVVVKRAIHAAPLNGINPSYQLTGKHSRFDVYTTRLLLTHEPQNNQTQYST